MRVKLAYTVEEEDVLPEAAKILGLSAADIQQSIDLYNSIRDDLSAASADEPVNIYKCLDMIDEYRKALLNIDTRLGEVTEMIKGYDDYQRLKAEKGGAFDGPPGEDLAEEAASDEVSAR